MTPTSELGWLAEFQNIGSTALVSQNTVTDVQRALCHPAPDDVKTVVGVCAVVLVLVWIQLRWETMEIIVRIKSVVVWFHELFCKKLLWILYGINIVHT